MVAVASPFARDQRIRLRDGRSLGYAEYGDPAGKAVFFFHGIPGSRLSWHTDPSLATSLGIRLIAPERPGYGLSDFQPGRTLLDWPDDVLALADALGLARFAVVGVSGGGPYAAACAFKIPHRLTAAAIVSGGAPLNAPAAVAGMSRLRRINIALVLKVPWLVHQVARWEAWQTARAVRRNAGRFLDRRAARAPASDRAILARADIRALFIENYAEAYRAGLRGHAWDIVVFMRPWGFRLEDIAVPVHLWHGGKDQTTPLSMGQYMASAIPRCRAHFLPEEGHLLRFNHWGEILSALVSEPG